MKLQSGRIGPAFDDIGIETLLRLDAAPTARPLEEFVAFICRRYALRAAAYYCPSFRGRSLAQPFLIVSSASVHVEHPEAVYKTIFAPVFSAGARTLLPLDWPPPQRQHRGPAPGAAAAQNGLTVPVRGPGNTVWALFGAASDESDADWTARRYDLTKDLVHVAYYIHQRAYDLHAKDAPIDINAITRREIEALKWSAEGKTPAEIAVLMRISLQTVKAHLDSARFKLHALNRVHAVSKAIRAGLIR